MTSCRIQLQPLFIDEEPKTQSSGPSETTQTPPSRTAESFVGHPLSRPSILPPNHKTAFSESTLLLPGPRGPIPRAFCD